MAQELRSKATGNKEAVNRRCSVEKVFLKISQNFQENTRVRVPFFFFLVKSQASACNFIKKETLASACNFMKKRLWHKRFLVNFATFLRTLFLTEHLRWLLLKIIIYIYILKSNIIGN